MLVGKLECEVIEQFWMTGALSIVTKVVSRSHKAGAEEVFPDSIHHHSGGQRVVGMSQPLGVVKSPAFSMGNFRQIRQGDDFGKSSWDGLIGRVGEFAAFVDGEILYLVRIGHSHTHDVRFSILIDQRKFAIDPRRLSRCDQSPSEG